jgi:hypothetical protein
VKEPSAAPVEDDLAAVDDNDETQDQGNTEAAEDTVAVGGVRAEISALFGRDAWAEFAHESGTLFRDIAARFAGVPTRAARAALHAMGAVLVRIKDGSVILGESIIEWVAAEEADPKRKKDKKKTEEGDGEKDSPDQGSEWPTPVRRGGVLLLVCAGIWHQGKDTPVAVAITVVTVWSVSALYSSRSGKTSTEPVNHAEKPDEVQDEAGHALNDHEISGETEEKPTREQAAVRLARYVEHAVAAAKHLHNKMGVHTETLLDGINRTEGLRAALLDPLAPDGGEWDVPGLNAALTALGIPVHNRGFKLMIDGKQRVRAGVRYDELAKHLGRRPILPPAIAEDRTRVYPNQ